MIGEIDLRVARLRIVELTLMYRRLLHFMEPDGSWDWLILSEIEELEQLLAQRFVYKTEKHQPGRVDVVA